MSDTRVFGKILLINNYGQVINLKIIICKLTACLQE